MTVLNNTMMQGTAAISEDTGYQIENSIRFNKTDFAQLTNTFPKSGNRRTWTFSYWVKRSSPDVLNTPIAAYSNASNETYLRIDGQERLGVNGRVDGTWGDSGDKYSNGRYRDPSAWLHVVTAVDSTNPIAEDRQIHYVNGVRDTKTGANWSQNFNSWMSHSKKHFIGNYANTYWTNDYMAELYFIDGLQLSPAAFGEFDSTGVWNPKAFAIPAPNDGTTWSDGTFTLPDSSNAAVSWATNGAITKMFDGNSNNNAYPNPNARYEWTIPDIPCSTSFRWSGDTNGSPGTSTLTTDAGTVDVTVGNIADKGWVSYTLPAGTTKLTKLLIPGDSTNWVDIGRIEVDGVLLRDGVTDKTYSEWKAAHNNDGRDWSTGGQNQESSDQTIWCDGGMGQGWLYDSTYRTFSSTDIVVDKQMEIWHNGGGTTTTLQDGDSNVYQLSSGGNKWVTVQNGNSQSGVPFTGTMKGPVKVKQATGSSYLQGVKVDGYLLIRNLDEKSGGNSFHLKFNETANVTQLGHDAFVDSTEDTKPVYSACTVDYQENYPPKNGFDGSLTTTTLGPNSGGIYKFDFAPLGGVAYTNGVQCYINNSTAGDAQYDRTRVNGGSWTSWNTGGAGDYWEWVSVATGSGTMNTFEIQDDPANSASGAAEGAFRALRINGDTILTDRGGNNWTPKHLVHKKVGTVDYAASITSSPTEHATNKFENIFHGDDVDNYNVHSYGSVNSVSHGSSFYITFTPSTAIPCTSSLVVGAYARAHCFNTIDIAVNDGSDIDVSAEIAGRSGYTNPNDVYSGVTGNQITKIKYYGTYDNNNAGGELPYIAYIEVDGKKLEYRPEKDVDISVDTPTNYSPAVGSDATGGVTRGNYCTMNPLTNQDYGYGSWTLTEGNLRARANDGSDSRIGGTIGVSSGKWYWEVEELANGNSSGIGINKEPNDYHATWNGTGDAVIYQSSGNKHISTGSGTGSAYGASYTEGDVIGVQWDADDGAIYFWKNGTLQNSGTAAKQNMSGLYTPCLVSTSSGTAADYSINFGQRPFKYQNAGSNRPAATYKCLCSTNLSDTFSGDEVNNPSKYFDILTHTGDNGSVTLTPSFGPDLVLLKSYDTTWMWNWFDRIRGDDKSLSSQDTGTEQTRTDQFTFNTSSVTVDEGANEMNNQDDKYVTYHWDAGTAAATASTDGNITPSAQWINATAGFSITLYSGLESTGKTVGHGLGAKPDLVICKNTLASRNWVVWHNGLDKDEHLILNTDDDVETSTTVWDNLDFTNTVVTLGANEDSNRNGNPTIMYAWTAIPGYSSFGKYFGTNTSSPGPFIYTGFKPRFILYKNIDTASTDWFIHDTVRSPYSNTVEGLQPNTNVVQVTNIGGDFDIYSNGFKMGTNNNEQNGDDNYIYAAFAEFPLKTTRSR